MKTPPDKLDNTGAEGGADRDLRRAQAVVTYSQLFRFLLPLAVTMLIQELGGQVLNGGMARVPRATETLAAFGLAWGISSFLWSFLWQVKQLSLVLVDSRQSLATVRRFVTLAGLLIAGILAVLALSPVGVWIIEDLHGLQGTLATMSREALFWMIPLPLLRGLALFYAGLLIRARRTDLASYAALAGVAASILSVFALLPTTFVREKPISLPLLVTYASFLSELVIAMWACRRHLGHLPQTTGREPSFSYVLRFFWPLALIMGVQGLSRPLINLFIAREAGAAEALAVLTVVYTLAHLAYGWVNEIRNLPPTFGHQPSNLPYILRFSLACGLFSFGLMTVLFWTPLRTLILETLIGLDPLLAAMAAAPLAVFSFMPLVVMARAYLHGLGMFQHRTRAMAPSGPARVVAIVLTLVILPLLGIQGATRGAAALLSGFVAETLVVYWGVIGRARTPKPVRGPEVSRSHPGTRGETP